ncbi:MAG TPA: hypothetical protein VGL99_33040 [Chloroflexota bacterium]|jgi:hypothetical protein
MDTRRDFRHRQEHAAVAGLTLLHIQGADAALEVEVLSPRTVRLRLLVPDPGTAGHAVALPPADPNVQVAVAEGNPNVIRTAELAVHVDVESLQVRFEDVHGQLLVEGLGFGWQAGGRVQARFRRATEEHY